NQAIGQMDQVTQQNAALVEQASAAAESMQEQAGKLAQVVAVFQIGGAQAFPRPAARANTGAPVRAASKALTGNLKTAIAKAPVRKPLASTAATTGGEWEEF
ncbi:MAG: methyl-accepting chemotaxis protein, partial [Burkholderiaceae bacterium]